VKRVFKKTKLVSVASGVIILLLVIDAKVNPNMAGHYSPHRLKTLTFTLDGHWNHPAFTFHSGSASSKRYPWKIVGRIL
jgi:hypothetical protein